MPPSYNYREIRDAAHALMNHVWLHSGHVQEMAIEQRAPLDNELGRLFSGLRGLCTEATAALIDRDARLPVWPPLSDLERAAADLVSRWWRGERVNPDGLHALQDVMQRVANPRLVAEEATAARESAAEAGNPRSRRFGEGEGGGDSGRPEGGNAASGAQGEGTAKRKRKGGKRPLEKSNPLKFQAYQRIQQAHAPGEDYVDTVTRLKGDKDFMEQVKGVGEKLDTKLVRKALAFFDQRRRDLARKKQETAPA